MALHKIPLAIAAVAAATGIGAASVTTSIERTTRAEIGELAGTAPKITITGTDFAFTLPDTIEAGITEIEFLSQGAEAHHVWFIRLDEGKTLADVYESLKKGEVSPDWATHKGGPNFAGPASSAFLDLTPGRYAVLCLIPSPDGTPHVMKGMSKEVVVTPRRGARAAREAAATAPVPTTTMTLVDYGYQLSKPLTAGRQVIKVVNAAEQPHEVFIAKLPPGKTAQDMVAWERNPQGPPPIIPIGGTTGLSKGEWNTLVLNLEPGEYALFCFVPDVKDRQPHTAHGMVTQITVK